jgi:hypothetical protein
MNTLHSHLIRSTRRPRGFAVLDASGSTLAGFVQPHWFRQEMTGTVDGHFVTITPTGFWKREFRIRIDGHDAGSVVTRPWGALRITLIQAGGTPVEMEFVRSGFWKNAHVLRIGGDHVLLEFQPRVNWKTFSLDHLVTVKGPGLSPEQVPLALALSGFCLRLVRQRQAAAAG